jgi:hypothetical protein
MAATVCSASAYSWCGTLRSSGLLCGGHRQVSSLERAGSRPADRYIRYKSQQLSALEQDGCAVMRGNADQGSNDFERQQIEE